MPQPERIEELLLRASLSRQLQQFESADALYGRALRLARKHAQPALTMEIYTLKARNLLNLGKSDAAMRALKNAAAASEAAFGGSSIEYSRAVVEMAILHADRGEFRRSWRCFNQALELQRPHFGVACPWYAITRVETARLSSLEGKQEESERILLDVLSHGEQVLGPIHPAIAMPLRRLSHLQASRGNFTDAEAHLERAIALTGEWCEVRTSEVAPAMAELADLYTRRGAYRKAEKLYQHSLIIFEQSADSPEDVVPVTIGKMGTMYQASRRYNEAAECFKRIISMREERHGQEDRLAIQATNSLGVVYRDSQDHDRAEPFLLRALNTAEKTMASEDPLLAQIYHDVAMLHYARDRYDRAEPLYDRALAIRETTGDEKGVAQSLTGLALVAFARRRYGHAEQYLLRVLEIKERLFGAEHPNLVETLMKLGRTYEHMGDLNKSSSLYDRAEMIEHLKHSRFAAGELRIYS